MTNSTLAALIVLAMMGGFAWFVHTGRFARLSARASAVAVETATSLGDRRQLVIVSVEGRRMLLGVTPTQVAFLTELQAAPPAAAGPEVARQ